MSLIGHSLGGYLSAAYTIRNPNIVKELVLLSPAGIPSPPPDSKKRTDSSSSTTSTDHPPLSKHRSTPSSPKTSAFDAPPNRRTSLIPSLPAFPHFDFPGKKRHGSASTESTGAHTPKKSMTNHEIASNDRSAQTGIRSPPTAGHATPDGTHWQGRRRSETLETLADRLQHVEVDDHVVASDNEGRPESRRSASIRGRRSSQPLSSSATPSAPARRVGFDEKEKPGGERCKEAQEDPEALAMGATADGGPEAAQAAEEMDEEEEDSDGENRKPQTFKGPMGKSGKTMSAVYSYMWEASYSPLSVIRKSGPLGPLFVGKYATHRFAELSDRSPTLARDLTAYLTNLISLPGSGEYSVSSLLKPGAFAHLPLAPRMAALGKDVGRWNGGVRVVFVYGAQDWMDVHGGKEALKVMRKKGNKRGEVVVVPDAGHHMYMDNAPATNELLWRVLGPSDTTPPTPHPQRPSTNFWSNSFPKSTIVSSSTDSNASPTSLSPVAGNGPRRTSSPLSTSSEPKTPVPESFFPPTESIVGVKERSNSTSGVSSGSTSPSYGKLTDSIQQLDTSHFPPLAPPPMTPGALAPPLSRLESSTVETFTH